MSDHNPTMFCHDGTSIYYPTAPGRVYIIAIAALADCDGSDEDCNESTATGDVSDLARATQLTVERNGAPGSWPPVRCEFAGTLGDIDHEATVNDFCDALEQWADWCDRDSERIDALDNLSPVIAEMSLEEVVACSQLAVAI